MIELIIGILLGFFIVLLAMKTGFDKDSSFYPVLLIVIAFYYVLFALQANNTYEIIFETSIAFLFSIIAILGHHKHIKIVGIALILHGIYDLFQGNIVFSTNPPQWWPLFCLGVDITLGIWVLWTSSRLLKIKK
ncbi:hypothetical protein MHM83_04870 [Tenacibaculum sp. Mcav3-52]|uniref:DUF6010 family protein n=1 Tax=unclassified Tenacibaculum TaxID=2635139 RepID=UPI0012E6CFE1|nr:DUF6010 family protein [Tenacibaculum sp. Mcav3-52]MCG7501194.1 hypothetical protein [Tenacibaculum sp. Mcav3-52]GFD72678.1 hypothetical protein KUL113_20980 [Tenacibaculum sp. KUL113]GFD80153.1 hypothetical protein KUL118_30150 [Tenacibaculum sp. KUL118]